VIVHPNLNPPSPSAVSQKNEALRSPSAVAPSPAASAAGQQPPSVQKMLTLSSPSAASSSAPPSTAGSTRDLLDIARATTTTVLPGVSTSPGPSSPNPSSASAAEDEKKTNGTSGKATLATLQPADGDIRVRVGATASKYEVDDEDSSIVQSVGVLSPFATTVDEYSVDETPVDSDYCPPFMIHPRNPWLFYWSGLLMAISLYNVFTVPYRWTFWHYTVRFTPDVLTLISLDCIGDVIFVLEIIKNLRLGYVSDGKIVWDPKRIRRNYTRSWLFLLDVVTCIPMDLVQFPLKTFIPAVRTGKMLRLFQLFRHIEFVEKSRSVSLWFKLSKLLFYTCILAHFGACIKYTILLQNPTLRPVIERHTAFGRYLVTLYWSLGAMVDRGDSNEPAGFGDYFLSTMCMFLGVLWTCNFAASMDQYTDSSDVTKKQHMEEYKQVKIFLDKFKLPEAIQSQVKSYYSYLWGSQCRYDIEATLESLPMALQAEVRLAAMGNTVGQAKLFEGLGRGCLGHILAKCERMVSLPGQMLIVRGTIGVEMFFLVDGKVDIIVSQGPGGSGGHDGAENERVIASLGSGDTFGEFACLFNTVRSSSVRSVDYCTLYVLSMEDLEETFELFDGSQEVIESNAKRQKQRMELQERNFTNVHSEGTGKAGGRNKLQQLMQPDVEVVDQTVKKWSISPNEKRYVIWEILHILSVLWNSAMVPLLIAFEPQSFNPFVMTISYLGDVIMVLDIALSFRVRFVSNGHEVSDVDQIRKNYLGGRFWLHIIASVPLDFLALAPAIGWKPSLRLNRILRVYDIHPLINNRIRHSKFPDVGALIYLCLNLLFVSHWCGCIYWVLSDQAGFLAAGVDGWQPSQAAAESQNSVLDYFTSLYWAMGLLVGYGSAYFPPNMITTVFTLFIQFVGLFAISYLIGTLGNTAGTLQVAAAAASEERTLVGEAFKYWGLPPELLRRVDGYLMHRWASEVGVNPNDALKLLPLKLRTEIMFQICGELLKSVKRLRELDDACIRTLVGELKFVEMPPNEYVFFQGQLGDEMYFIARGTCEIVKEGGAALGAGAAGGAGGSGGGGGGAGGSGGGAATPGAGAGKSSTNLSRYGHSMSVGPPAHTVIKTVTVGSFVGEGALFTGVRAASLRCASSCLLYSLSTAGFQRVMHQHPEFAASMLSTHEQRRMKLHLRAQEALASPRGHSTSRQTPGTPSRHVGAAGGASKGGEGGGWMTERSTGGGGQSVRNRPRAATGDTDGEPGGALDPDSSLSPDDGGAPLHPPKTKLGLAVVSLLERHPTMANRKTFFHAASSVAAMAAAQGPLSMGDVVEVAQHRKHQLAAAPGSAAAGEDEAAAADAAQSSKMRVALLRKATAAATAGSGAAKDGPGAAGAGNAGAAGATSSIEMSERKFVAVPRSRSGSKEGVEPRTAPATAPVAKPSNAPIGSELVPPARTGSGIKPDVAVSASSASAATATPVGRKSSGGGGAGSPQIAVREQALPLPGATSTSPLNSASATPAPPSPLTAAPGTGAAALAAAVAAGAEGSSEQDPTRKSPKLTGVARPAASASDASAATGGARPAPLVSSASSASSAPHTPLPLLGQQQQPGRSSAKRAAITAAANAANASVSPTTSPPATAAGARGTTVSPPSASAASASAAPAPAPAAAAAAGENGNGASSSPASSNKKPLPTRKPGGPRS